MILPVPAWDRRIWTAGHFWSGRGPSTWRYQRGVNERPHTGIDLAAPSGSEIVAPEDGLVTFSGWTRGGGGYTVAVRHRLPWRGVPTFIWSRHCHCLPTGMAPRGEFIQRGGQIARVGSTGASAGPHDHHSLIVGKEWADWRTERDLFIDPEPVYLHGEALLMQQGHPWPEDVERLQRRLNQIGYTPVLRVDGDYGAATAAAVAWWQGKARLHQSGEASPITLATLFARRTPT